LGQKEHVSDAVYKLIQDGGVENLEDKLKTNFKAGITGLDVELRKTAFGSNIKPLPKTHTLFDLILECFEDTMLRILVGAALVSTIVGMINDGPAHGWTEGASIFFAICLITSVTAGNNYAKEKQFQKLQAREKESQTIPVIRN